MATLWYWRDQSFAVEEEEQAKSSAEAATPSNGGPIFQEWPHERQRSSETQRACLDSVSYQQGKFFARACQGRNQTGPVYREER